MKINNRSIKTQVFSYLAAILLIVIVLTPIVIGQGGTPPGANNNAVNMTFAAIPSYSIHGGTINYYWTITNPSTFPLISADATNLVLTF